MNQTRNLIINIIINILITILFPYLIFQFSGFKNDISKPILIGFVYVFSLLISTLISDTDGEFRRFNVFPPVGLIIILFLLYHSIRGNIKITRTVDYKFFIRYTNGVIYVYNFKPLTLCRIMSLEYHSAEHSSNRLRELLYKYSASTLSMRNKKGDFSKWDGSLDDESKRMNTIDKIIK